MRKKYLLPMILILTLLISSYFDPLYLTESLGLLFIILATLKWGFKQGLVTATGTTLVIFTADYIFDYQIRWPMLLTSTIFNFLTVLIICRTLYVIREKNKQLKEAKKELEEKNNLLQSILGIKRKEPSLFSNG